MKKYKLKNFRGMATLLALLLTGFIWTVSSKAYVSPVASYPIPWPANSLGIHTSEGVIQWQNDTWLVINGGGPIMLHSISTGATYSTLDFIDLPSTGRGNYTGGAHVLADGRLVLACSTHVLIIRSDWTLQYAVALPYQISFRKGITAGVIVGNEWIVVREVSRSDSCSFTAKLIAIDLNSGNLREGALTSFTSPCGVGYGGYGLGDVELHKDGNLYIVGNWTDGTGASTLAIANPVNLTMQISQSVGTTFHNPSSFALAGSNATFITTTVSASQGTWQATPAVIFRTNANSYVRVPASDYKQAAIGFVPDVHVAVAKDQFPVLSIQGTLTSSASFGNWLLRYNGNKFIAVDRVPVLPREHTQSFSVGNIDGLIWFCGPSQPTEGGEPMTINVYDLGELPPNPVECNCDSTTTTILHSERVNRRGKVLSSEDTTNSITFKTFGVNYCTNTTTTILETEIRNKNVISFDSTTNSVSLIKQCK
jgi:hypothetical protein